MLSPNPPVRLCSVTGYDNRTNDVVFCSPARKSDDLSTVVYFGGDVQDFPEIMKLHGDNKDYIKWNLENTASMLNVTFPNSYIVVVRPSRIEFKTFSCYNNFVPSGNAGVPEHTPTHYALQHLEQLLRNVSQRIKSMSKFELRETILSSSDQRLNTDVELLQMSIESLNSKLKHESNFKKDCESKADDKDLIRSDVEPAAAVNNRSSHENQRTSDVSESPDKNITESSNWWFENLALDRTKLTLIGFSKGCVVLNQFIYEFHYLKTLTPDDVATLNFVSRISDMFWLDGGHAGGKNTWITSRSLLETLTRLCIKVWVHVTPYQVQDNRRAWIRREEHSFTETLEKLGAQIRRTLHFDGTAPDLNMHFNILNVFKSPQSYEDFTDK